MRKTSNEQFKEYVDAYCIHQAGIVCHTTVFGLYEFALYNMKLCIHARCFLLYLFTSPLLLTSCSPQSTERVCCTSEHYTPGFTTLNRSPLTYFTAAIPGNRFMAQFTDGLRVNQKSQCNTALGYSYPPDGKLLILSYCLRSLFK